MNKILNHIQKVAQEAYDNSGMLPVELPIDYDTACERNSGDTLFDFMVIELQESMDGGESLEEMRNAAVTALDRAIADLMRSRDAVAGIREVE